MSEWVSEWVSEWMNESVSQSVSQSVRPSVRQSVNQSMMLVISNGHIIVISTWFSSICDFVAFLFHTHVCALSKHTSYFQKDTSFYNAVYLSFLNFFLIFQCYFDIFQCYSLWISNVWLSTLTLYGHIKNTEQWTSNTVIGTLAIDGCAVTFGTARMGLGTLGPSPVPSVMYQM